MSQIRIDVREVGDAGSFGAGLGAAAPPALRDEKRVATTPAERSRSWWARGLRVVRNAAIAVAVMALVPIGLVTVNGDRLARIVFDGQSNTAQRMATAERVRRFRLSSDPSITPLQAGAAMNALQPLRPKTAGFVRIDPGPRPVAPWDARPLTPEMFPTARPDLYAGPSTRTILEASVKGFSPRELEYLRALAAAPQWRELDLVARAPSVDVVGAQLRIPFGVDARAEARPIPSYKGSRELAYAAVSRAAYYMAIGEPEKAETVLRSIISFGFAYVDNGTTAIEGLVGMSMVGVGRDALQRFYAIRHDPRANDPALESPVKWFQLQRHSSLSVGEERRRLLARIEDPAQPLGLRFESLQALRGVSCTNVKELLFGPDADVRAVQERAARTLARYPSERALIELQRQTLASPPYLKGGSPIQQLAVSSASVAGTVLRNPRLASCTTILTTGW